ncbi:MAG: virulence RhuM family protein [Tannerella sp.]|jgi:prophage maintenance system killer protein|nr:virulence RhuM family protein [Tannerella sp.]
MESKGEIIIYQAPDGTTDLNVRLENETVWLTQAQMGLLFDKNKRTISEHISNIFKEGELLKDSVVRKFRTTATDSKQYDTYYYNLDVIISVGYRVKSKQGTLFRIWANKVLKEYLIKGYIVHGKIKAQQYEDLRQTVQLLSNVMQHKELDIDEATGLLQVITDYTYALDTLDKYDYQQLTVENTTADTPFHATYENAMEAINFLRHKFGGSDLFGNEKDQSFRSSIATIYQTFGGVDLYPSIEEKAAMLLYLVTKNHSFSDGNKRIAAFLFLWFMEKNGILYRSDGSKLIENNTLVALTLMIAESRTEEKDVMVKVIVNLINRSN